MPVTSRFLGRLGNSMFQIAAAIGYARKYGYQWAVHHDAGNSDSAIHRVYPNLPKSYASGNRYHEHTSNHCSIHGCHFDICHFDYHPIPDIGQDITLSGFFQSWRYFENADEEIKKIFELPHWIEYEEYVSIHVRRGDYVIHANSFPPVTMDYLNKSINKFPSDQKFIVFSDDIAWCKQNLLDERFEFSQDRNEKQDLEIMASCKHHIICNSTFSWWGAYLGHNPNRIVIAPSCERGNWFGYESGVKKDCVDLLPQDWIQIKWR